MAVSGNESPYPKAETGVPKPPEDTKPARVMSPPKVEVPSAKPGPIARWVADKYRDIGKMLTPVDSVCGSSFTLAADNAGMAWERAYKSSDFVKKLVDRLMESSVVADLFFANLPIIMAVMAHHNEGFRNYVNDSFLGFMVPADLKTEPDQKESAA